METNEQSLARKIIDAALEIYIESPELFTLRKIAAKADCSVADITRIFPGKQNVLRGFYNQIPSRFKEAASEIPEYESLTLGEKFANYVYTSFDIIQEHRDFVEKTFEEMVLPNPRSPWHIASREILREFVENDPRIPTVNLMLVRDFTYNIWVHEYFQLIKFWLSDDSDGSERTIALVDKISALLTEAAYSGILDKGFDLAKYVFANDIWKHRVPSFVKEVSSMTKEIKKSMDDFCNSEQKPSKNTHSDTSQ